MIYQAVNILSTRILREDRSDLCDTNNASNAYITVKETITAEGTNPVNRKSKILIFKKIALFRSFISKINNIYGQCGRSSYCYADV